MGKPILAIFNNDMSGGGAERVITTLIHDLRRTFDIHLVLINEVILYELPKDLPVHILSKKSLESSFSKFASLPFLAKQYALLCKSLEVEVSFSFNYRSNYVNSLSRKFANSSRIVLSERAFPSSVYSGNSLASRISRYLIRKCYPMGDLLISNAKRSMMDLKENFGYAGPSKVIYNPIREMLEPPSLKKEIRRERFHFLNIANLNNRKDHVSLLTAFAQIENKNTFLHIAGSGDKEAQLKDLSNSLNVSDRVKFYGRVNDVASLYAIADCFVLSSIMEGFPNVLLEAMQFSIPIISTDCKSGPRELLAPDTDFKTSLKAHYEVVEYGVLVPVSNDVILKEAMEMMIDNAELRAVLSQSSKSRIGDFEPKTIADQFKEALLSVMSRTEVLA